MYGYVYIPMLVRRKTAQHRFPGQGFSMHGIMRELSESDKVPTHLSAKLGVNDLGLKAAHFLPPYFCCAKMGRDQNGEPFWCVDETGAFRPVAGIAGNAAERCDVRC
jgi:hypothetical protein